MSTETDENIHRNSDYPARHPEMLEELEYAHDRLDTTDINAYLWAGTFLVDNGGPLEHYYNTYAIRRDGMLVGSHNPRNPKYLILSEFSGIAFHLINYLIALGRV